MTNLVSSKSKQVDLSIGLKSAFYFHCVIFFSLHLLLFCLLLITQSLFFLFKFSFFFLTFLHSTLFFLFLSHWKKIDKTFYLFLPSYLKIFPAILIFSIYFSPFDRDYLVMSISSSNNIWYQLQEAIIDQTS